MIFRRSSDTPVTQNKTSMNSANRTSTAPTRREPEIRTPMTATQPVSPISVAQSRRTPSTPANNFQRGEQLRKLTVGRDISLNGEITTCDHLVVEGNVTATIKGGQILEISESGSFSGYVDIQQADIAGRFDGDLTVRDKLIIRPGAYVTGTIQYGRLQVDTGATLNGQIACLPPVAAAAPNAPSSSSSTHDVVPTDSMTNSMNYNATNAPRATGLSSLGNEAGFLKASA